MAQTRIVHDLWAAARGHRTAVSLHSHTHHSRENLAFLPGWISRITALNAVARIELSRQHRRHGRALDFSRAYWCPPLSPRAVIESESTQIAARLGLDPLVSITDHDNIDASLGLATLGLTASYPTSVEWTVPFGGQVFHLGIHNLPPETAGTIINMCRAFTARPAEGRLGPILDTITGDSATLVVLNHPLWNARIDKDQDHSVLRAFLRACRPYLHATEINGYRSHAENKAAIRLGREWNLPVVAGGDRHGRAPNAMLNLTTAATFSEFVDEVRYGGRSCAVIMPEYQQHRATRVLEVIGDVLRHDSSLDAGQQRWVQRGFVIGDDGQHRPLEQYWTGVPLWIRALLRGTKLMGSVTARQALRLGLAVDDGGVL